VCQGTVNILLDAAKIAKAVGCERSVCRVD
jgi:hypothetical protein